MKNYETKGLWIGVGCVKGTSKELIATAIERVCQRYYLARKALAGLATIDLKAEEPGLLELSKEWGLPLVTFSVQALSQVNVPNPSTAVNQAIGSFSVAEAAAMLASNQDGLLVSKQIVEKVTVAIAIAKEEL